MIELPRPNLDVTAEEASSALLRSVRQALRRDLRFLMFFLSPHLQDFRDEPGWYESTYRLPSTEILRMRSDLLRAGLWREMPGEGIQVRTARLGLADNGEANMPLADFMTMVTQVLSHLSSEKHCWAQSHTVVTSHSAVREFLTDVHTALEKFLEKSKDAPGETTLTWSHISMNTLQALQSEKDL